MTTPSIVVKGLHVTRQGQEVLSDLNFQVAAGEVFALLGGNGAGKSTTLLTCIGMLKPSAGSVTICGHSAADEPEAVRRSLAYLSETASLYEHLSARENLRYFLELAGTKPDPVAIEQALDTVSLQADARDRRSAGFSKGMRQKVAIALALLRKTPVLLLDEPTSGLDPVAVEEFNRLLITLCQRDVAILMVTHDLFGACEVSSRIGLLRDGHLVNQFEASRDVNGKLIHVDVNEVKRSFAGREAA
ncbi:MAG: ABC transporter ATP-binding protein [Gammaproteobacteria bacterium]|nr:ABC transporter ATP-binding protein [Gammaproteobacteria bacterium]|tara:strand:+ start:203 stop:940 length:738 start_codon:yes stop_codon:yes gene_type:complete